MDEVLKKRVMLGVALALVVAVSVALGVHYHSTPGEVSENSSFERIPKDEPFLGKCATKLNDFHCFCCAFNSSFLLYFLPLY